MTILDKLRASLADCPACSVDDLPDDLSADEIAEYAAMHGLQTDDMTADEARATLSDEEVRLLADGAERVERAGRLTFLRRERTCRSAPALIPVGALRIRVDSLPQ